MLLEHFIFAHAANDATTQCFVVTSGMESFFGITQRAPQIFFYSKRELCGSLLVVLILNIVSPKGSTSAQCSVSTY